ncbi:MAG: SCO family protein [Hyphomicrobium sp.]|nr:SCO family protein [Hyphomicrobium sp.]
MRRFPLLLILALVLATPPFLTTLFSAASEPVADRFDRLFGGPFELTSANQSRVSDGSLRGQFLLVMFGYTNCPDICPTGLVTVGEALDNLAEEASAVQAIFITVDPARDTPERLKEYATSFDPRILMLTGSETEISAVVKSYRVHRQTYALAEAGSKIGHYGVDHGSLMYLMGPDGQFRTIFPHGTTAEQLTAALRRYLSKR